MKPDLSGKYAVVGVGYTPQGKVPGRTALSFHLEACANAVRDSGLGPSDLDGLICYRHFPPSESEVEVTPYLVAHHLGIAPNYLSQDAN
jgi:3-oxoacyl-[acyl-carrier-protein] synthase III